jgi:hypothetical protein
MAILADDVTHQQILRFIIGKVLRKLGSFVDDFVVDICNAGHLWVFALDGNQDTVEDVWRKERIVLRKYELQSYGIFKFMERCSRIPDTVIALQDLEGSNNLCDCVLPKDQNFEPIRQAVLTVRRASRRLTAS